MPSGPKDDPDRLHLYVVCTDPDEDGDQLIVSISTRSNEFCDDACILQAHEHDFLRHESYVFYRKAKLAKAEALNNGVASKLFTPHADFNAQAFLKILKGFCNSLQCPRKIKKYLDCPKEDKASA